MQLRVTCTNPSCAKTATIPAEHLGKVVRCRACSTQFLVGGKTSTWEDGSPLQETTEGSPAPPPLPPLPAPPPAGKPQTTPETIGRYVVRSRLGKGAFGTVYRVYDPQLDRDVALKVPHHNLLETPSRVERFLREGRAAAGLRHPNIVPVYDSGKIDGNYFIASAFIKGQPLEKIIEEKGIDCQRAAKYIRAIAEGLAYAHEQGVVHRDIKPANVMLDEDDSPLIADFGLAARKEEESRLTNDGTILGTPSYMAPEQAAGQKGESQPAADQYSLGIMLYELLVGHTPFEGPPAIVIHNQIHTEPEAPRLVRKDIPLDLETICLKALSKNPADRYPDCRALADDLRRWQEGEPIAARRLGFVERSVRWAKKEPKLAAALGTVLASLVVIGLLLGVKLRETIRDRDIFRDRIVTAEQNEELSHQETEEARLERDDERLAVVAANADRDSLETEKNLAGIPENRRGPDWGLIAMKARGAPEFGRLLHRPRQAYGGTVWLGFQPNDHLLGLGADRWLTDWNVWNGAASSVGNLTGKLPGTRFGLGGKRPLDQDVLASADGKRVAILTGGGGIKNKEGKETPLTIQITVLDIATGKEINSWKLEGFWQVGAINADGSQVAVAYARAGEPYRLGIWNVESGARMPSLDKDLAPFPLKEALLTFSPDGKAIAATTAHDQGELRAWSVPEGEEVMLISNIGVVSQMAFSPDGQRLAAVGGAKVEKRESDLGAFELPTEVAESVTTYKTVSEKISVKRTMKATDGKDCEVEYQDTVFKQVPVATTVKVLKFIPIARPGPWLEPYYGTKSVMAIKPVSKTFVEKIPQIRKGKRTENGKTIECECPDTVEVTKSVIVNEKVNEQIRSRIDGLILQVWDRPTNALTFQVKELEPIEAICWRGDGLRLASATKGKRLKPCDATNPLECEPDLPNVSLIKLWQSRNASLLNTLEHESRSTVSCLAWSRDGIHLAAGFNEIPSVACWSAESKQLVATRREHQGAIYDLAFSPDGKLLASFGKCNELVRIWDGDSATLLHSVGPAEAFSQFGKNKFLITGLPRYLWVFLQNFYSPVSIWNRETGEKVEWPGTRVVAAAHTSTGARAIVAESVPAAKQKPKEVRDVETGAIVSKLDETELITYGLWTMTSDGRYAIWSARGANNQSSVLIWNATSGRIIFRQGNVLSIAYEPTSELFAAIVSEPKKELMILKPTGVVASSIPYERFPQGMEFIGEDRILVMAWGRMQIFDIKTGKLFLELPCGFDTYTISPDKKLLAILQGKIEIPKNATQAIPIEEITLSNGTIQLVDLATGRVVRDLKVQSRFVVDISFSPDGKLLAYSGHTGPTLREGVIDIVTVEKGNRIASLRGHQRTVKRIVFRPDGKLLASGGSDSTVRFWRVPSVADSVIPDDPVEIMPNSPAPPLAMPTYAPAPGPTYAPGPVPMPAVMPPPAVAPPAVPKATPQPKRTDREMIAELEQKLAEIRLPPGMIAYDLHNGLRHHYGAVDIKKSMMHVDIILKHVHFDGYMKLVLAGGNAKIDKVVALKRYVDIATKYTDLPYLAATCWIWAAEYETDKSKAREYLDKALAVKGLEKNFQEAINSQAMKILGSLK